MADKKSNEIVLADVPGFSQRFAEYNLGVGGLYLCLKQAGLSRSEALAAVSDILNHSAHGFFCASVEETAQTGAKQ